MLTQPASTSRKGRRFSWSLLAFRAFAALVAFLFLIFFEEWRKMLHPWMPYTETDGFDFGWDRHADLFLVPDTAVTLFQFAFGIAALILLVHPLGVSGLVSWLAAGLLMCSWASMFTALWAGTSLVEMTLLAVVMTVVLCVPLVLFHPQRKAIIRGGLPAKGAGPGNFLRWEMAVLGIAGAGLAIGSSIWRAGGGLFENPREDSVLSLVLFGLVLALGALLCRLGREGWKTLAYILNGMLAYALIALLTYAIS
ncbi:hypothetical protein [Arthrobacter sp.]|uniref:hypothetical protein n=1 Tax=Arthrobacter sp. TaxID=1667 RepID=UPI0026DF8D1E|nr:hypothetical protein [Arthrobacter sp.]MDO5753732.1 hypothetical protein [Arthrobacter sp.]